MKKLFSVLLLFLFCIQLEASNKVKIRNRDVFQKDHSSESYDDLYKQLDKQLNIDAVDTDTDNDRENVADTLFCQPLNLKRDEVQRLIISQLQQDKTTRKKEREAIKLRSDVQFIQPVQPKKSAEQLRQEKVDTVLIIKEGQRKAKRKEQERRAAALAIVLSAELFDEN